MDDIQEVTTTTEQTANGAAERKTRAPRQAAEHKLSRLEQYRLVRAELQKELAEIERRAADIREELGMGTVRLENSALTWASSGSDLKPARRTRKAKATAGVKGGKKPATKRAKSGGLTADVHALITDIPDLSASAIAEKLNVPTPRISAVVNQLKKTGRIKSKGGRRNMTFRVA